MDNEQIKKISLAFDIEEISIIECLKNIAKQPLPKKIKKSIFEENIEPELITIKNDEYFYFLEDDYGKLENKIAIINLEISRLGKEIAHSVDVSGETFHDNFVYDEGNRQQAMWSNEIKKLTNIKNKARIVDTQKNDGISENRVSIGKKVTLLVNGKQIDTKIGSYLTFDKHSISYESVLAKNIMNLAEKEHKNCVIDHKKVSLTIIKID